MASDWRVVPLAQLYDFSSGLSKPRAAFGSGYPFLGFKDVFYNSSVPSQLAELVNSTEQERAGCSIKRGDVFVTRTSETMDELGMSCVALRDVPNATFNGFTKRLRPKNSDTVVPEYARYYFRAPTFRQAVTAMSSMSTRASLNNEMLARLSVVLPSPEEQEAIGRILGALDDKIELNRRMNEALEAIARAFFKSWFVDFDPVRAKAEARAPGLPQPLADLFPDSFEDSELGETPKGWRVSALGELIYTVKGRSYKSEELVESDTALVTLKSFARGGGYRPDGLKPFAGTYKAEQVVEPGELVIACTDVTQAADVIGRPAIVRGKGRYRRLVASLDTLIVRPRHSRITRAFLYFLGGTEAFVAHTYAHTTGTTVLHLAKEAIPSFTFALPSMQLVDQFDSLASPILDRIQALEEQSGTLAAVREALLPRLISGELRVKDAERYREIATA